MNEVLPGLFIGSLRDSRDEEQLRCNDITHVISIHDNPTKSTFNNLEYMFVIAADHPNEKLSQHFSRCNQFIHQARVGGGSVLIHCLAGVSRSVTIACAYIMSVTCLGWREAVACILAARVVANPNDGFIRQLRNFQRTGKLRKERKRLVELQSPKITAEDSLEAGEATSIGTIDTPSRGIRRKRRGQMSGGSPLPSHSIGAEFPVEIFGLEVKGTAKDSQSS